MRPEKLWTKCRLGDELNEALPRLEQLVRLPEALKVINRRVAEVKRAIKTTSATVKRLKIDAADEIKMQSLLAEAKEATAKLKAGSIEDADTFFDYIQESIMGKLDEDADNFSNDSDRGQCQEVYK